MAQRFGGKFSRGGTGGTGGKGTGDDPGSYLGARRTRAGGRVNFLFLAPLPLVWQAFFSGGGATGMALNLLALGVLLLAAWLTREGILAQEAYDARKIARRPAFPRKIIGSVLTGLGLGLAGAAAQGGLAAPAIYAAAGAVLHLLSFGPDPLADKGMDGADRFQGDRVARVVDQAESYLAAMTEAIRRAGDRQAEARVERFQSSVRDMLRTVENDPRDLTAARRYLGVYLMGARDATEKFADIYARTRDDAARADYLMLLTDLEQNFVARTRVMLEDNNTDLEVEIGVLRERLQREGVHLDRST